MMSRVRNADTAPQQACALTLRGCQWSLGDGDTLKGAVAPASDGRIRLILWRHANQWTVGRRRRWTSRKPPCSITTAVIGLTIAAFTRSHTGEGQAACRRDAAHFARFLSDKNTRSDFAADKSFRATDFEVGYLGSEPSVRA